jgi:phage terminase large subunit-like protein
MSRNRDWISRTEAQYAKRKRTEILKAEFAAYAEYYQREAEQRLLFEGHKRAASAAMREYQTLLPRGQAVKPDMRLMTDQQLAELKKEVLKAERYDWSANGRPEQMQPEDYRTWFLCAGRGAGKTRAGSEAIREWCREPNQRIGLVAKDHRNIRDVLIDGPSGILACTPPEDIKSVKTGLGDVGVTFVNGSVIYGFSSEQSDALRGRAFDACVVDEFAAHPKNKAQDVIDQLWFCMRDSVNPRMIITTTPKRVPHILALMKRVEAKEPGLIMTTGRTRDNTHLSEIALAQLDRMYAGTRMGRQEMEGELILDLELALWNGEMVEAARWDSAGDFPKMVGVITGVDPSGSETGDATGIVTCGWDKAGVIYVLENKSTQGTPVHRYSEVCRSAQRWGAGEIWSESAFSGDSSIYGIEQQWKNLVRDGEFPAGASTTWSTLSTAWR